MTRLARYIIEHYLVVPLAAVVAIVWANASSDSYFNFAETLSFLINDVGMTFVFAFLMQEVLEAMLVCGTLSWIACFWGGVHPALALLPIVPFFPHTARHLYEGLDSVEGRHVSEPATPATMRAAAARGTHSHRKG